MKIYTKGNVSLKDIEADLKGTEKDQKTSYEEYHDTIETVKAEFKELLSRIGAKYTNKTVVIFFDDLDRCLPDDAIQLLEAIKNLFVIPGTNVIFICGIDTRVAKQFIKSHYKDIEETFAINYFRKIFNLTISMPFSAAIYEMLLNYIQKLFTRDELNGDMAKALANMIYTLGLEVEISSVRHYLNIVHNFYTFLKFNSEYQFNPTNDFVIHLLIFKEAWQPLYENLVREALKERSQMSTVIQGFLRNYKRVF